MSLLSSAFCPWICDQSFWTTSRNQWLNPASDDCRAVRFLCHFISYHHLHTANSLPALFNLQLSYQSHGDTNNRNRSQLLNSLDAGSVPPGNLRGCWFFCLVFFWGGGVGGRVKNPPPISWGEYLSEYTGLSSLALGTPRGVIWQSELLLLRVVWLAS